jgi:hypothetical protein
MTGKDTIIRLGDYLAEEPSLSFCNTDIKGWDSLRARFILLDIFHKVLKPNMQLDEPWKELAFEYIVEAFIFTFLALPDGSVFKKLSGVPSGSFLTLLINSLAVHNVMSASLKYNEVTFYDTRVLGDDFCYKLDPLSDQDLTWHVHDLSETARRFFDIVVSPEKVIATNVLEDRKFIGYQVRGGKLFREDRDLFCGVLYPESPVKSLAVSFTRLYSYMLIGGFGSGRFRQFYERYLGGYYDELVKLGADVFRRDVMKHGNLRVFKHVFKVDLEEFENFSIDSFRNVFSYKAPFFLTLGAHFMLS